MERERRPTGGRSPRKTARGKYPKTLKVRIDADLHAQVEEQARQLGTDVSSFVRWCVRTSLYLKDLNLYVQSKDRRG